MRLDVICVAFGIESVADVPMEVWRAGPIVCGAASALAVAC